MGKGVREVLTSDAGVSWGFLLAVVAVIVMPVTGSLLALNQKANDVQAEVLALQVALVAESERSKGIDEKLDDRYMSKDAGAEMLRSAQRIERHFMGGE